MLLPFRVVRSCSLVLLATMVLAQGPLLEAHAVGTAAPAAPRDRVSLNTGWRFSRFTSNPDSLSYDKLKPWMLPSANDFIKGTKHQRPAGSPPGNNASYVGASFDDSAWEQVNLPHDIAIGLGWVTMQLSLFTPVLKSYTDFRPPHVDWAVKGPFNAPGIGGGMGRLPSNGVGWYRRKVSIAQSDIQAGKSLFLDIDGAMSYAAVWLNGNLIGGWPYGYNSFRLDLTQDAQAGDNILAIRVDNALDSSRWYPGAGIYRNVWLVKVEEVHVRQYGTYITTPSVSAQSAIVNLIVEIENRGNGSQTVDVATDIFAYDSISGKATGDVVATFPKSTITVQTGVVQSVNSSTTVLTPRLWGPAPAQKPNLYIAITTLSSIKASVAIDVYETRFGIRTIVYDADKGVLVNGQRSYIQGTCNHHDLGSLGAAFNVRAAERQLQMLQEMGSNAIRTSHNPPAPEILDLADRLGMLVLDEIFDCWNNQKTKNDYHLIFPDWHEPDLRSFVRRDRNHPSVIAWSVGNEIGEQSSAAGGATTKELRDIARTEDPTRGVTVAMNSAGPTTQMANAVDIIGLNYQGEGRGTSTSGSFSSFRSTFPNKMIWSSESSSVLSTRGTYIFPVTSGNSATVGGASAGGNDSALQVSSYELYAPSWGSSPDKVFTAQDKNPYVAGEYVWTGWDYIGEPTPYDSARSSYFGIIDMAGFKKDRFYLYQSRWRPDFPAAHILPHWTWSADRIGQVTPVHVFSSGTEAELFVNGKSQGRIKRGQYEYRFRWDNVTYHPGDLKVVTYKNGAEWATSTTRTVGEATSLNITSDTATLTGESLAFITVAVVDKNGDLVPRASNSVTFKIDGPGTIVSTDNGNPADMTAFPSTKRNAFGGLVLAIVRSHSGVSGRITVSASTDGLAGAQVVLQAT